MDNFKEYLLLHKTQLDLDSPPDDAWQQIAGELQAGPNPAGDKETSRRPVNSRIPMIKYAVAACLITLAGAGLWLVVKNKPVTNANAVNNTSATKSETATDTSASRATAVNAVTPYKAASSATTTKTHKRKSKTPDEVELIGKSYATLINQQLKKLRSTPLYAESSNYFAFYVDQFKQMDHDEQTVRADIGKYGLTNEILEQLINVYQQKLNLLKSLQTEVNKMNNKVIERQPRPTKPEVHYLNI